MINLILIICKAFFGIVFIVLLAFIGLSFSRGLRSKYQLLKCADGNKKLMLFLICSVCVILYHVTDAVQSYLTDRQKESMKEPALTTAILGTKLRIINEGSVKIKEISKKAIIAGYFDVNTRKITDHQVVIFRLPLLLEAWLLPNKSVDLDIFPHLIPIPTVTPMDTTGIITVYGLVLTYKRAADMKPFVKFLPFAVPFAVLKDTNIQSIDMFFMPLFPQPGSAEAGDTNFRVNEEARDELIRLYNDKVAEVKIE